MEPRRWELTYDRRFERELSEIEPDAPKADEFVRYLVDVLSQNPHMGRQVDPDFPVWALPMKQSALASPVILYYTFDEEHVWFMSIQTTGFDD